MAKRKIKDKKSIAHANASNGIKSGINTDFKSFVVVQRPKDSCQVSDAEYGKFKTDLNEYALEQLQIDLNTAKEECYFWLKKIKKEIKKADRHDLKDMIERYNSFGEHASFYQSILKRLEDEGENSLVSQDGLSEYAESTDNTEVPDISKND